MVDNDAWTRTAIKSISNDCHEHASLCIFDELGHCFELKEEAIRPTNEHLGMSVHDAQLHNGLKAWLFGCTVNVLG